MKFVQVNVLYEAIPEDEIENLNKKQDLISQVPRDEHARTVEQYEDLGIPAPKELVELTKKYENGGDEIEYEDIETEIRSRKGNFVLDYYVCCIKDIEFGTHIYLKNKMTLWVLETPRQIENKINKLLK